MTLWGQEGGDGGGFQQRKTAGGDGDTTNGQRSIVKGVLTCTVATIIDAKHSESENCFVNKHWKFNAVMVMGLIREESDEINGSLTIYHIDDHSGGLLEIKWWHDDSSESFKPLTYIKVIGQVKIFNEKTDIVAYHISRMQSLNQLIVHSIECVHTSLFIRKQRKMIPTVSNGHLLVQNTVLHLLRNVTSITGYSVTEICNQLKQYSDNQVKKALEFLSGEGHIYPTIDDDHYRAAHSY